MYIIAGLGNPGKQYDMTRHNIGFHTIDYMADKLNVKVKKLKFKALYGECEIAGEKTLLIKPQTYMNLSGESVKELLAYYKAGAEDLIVLYDDYDLPKGALRIRKGGSAGTHNGMRNIVYLTGSQAFPRVRVGIGKPEHAGQELAAHVLGKYPPEQRQLMFDAFTRAADAIRTVIADGVDKAMAQYNG